MLIFNYHIVCLMIYLSRFKNGGNKALLLFLALLLDGG